MTGAITREAGRYRVRVQLNGERKTLGRFDTRAEAEEVLSAWMELQEAAVHGHTVGSWGMVWLDQREIAGHHRDIRGNRSSWRTHVAPHRIAQVPLGRLTSHDVARWIREVAGKTAQRSTRGISRQTVTNALNLLRAALTDAVLEGRIPQNPARGIPVPKMRASSEDKWTFLSAAEIRRLLSCDLIPESSRIAFAAAIYTGLRAGELWGLRWQDVILSGDRPELIVRHSRLEATKSGRIRHVPLLPQAATALRRWRDLRRAIPMPHTLVWPREDGGCHVGGYDAGWRDHRRLAGIMRRVRFHDLRHTCASHLIMGTWTYRPLTVAEVQGWLGHSTPTLAARYQHLAPDHLSGIVHGSGPVVAQWPAPRSEKE